MTQNAKTAIVKATEDASLIPLTAANIINYVNAEATPQEVAIFLNLCQMFGLNPFKREIYLIKYDAKDKAAYVVGYESYLKRADRTGRWSGMESGTEEGKGERPIKAWAKIYRKDWAQPLYHEVYFEEYAQYHKDYKTGQIVLTKFWREKPRTMLKKVAIAQALRMAFPDEFGGMPYTAEEMPVEHAALPTTEVKETKKETAGTPPGPKDTPPAGPDPAASDDIAAMAETQAPEMTEEQLKKHKANVGAIKMILEGQVVDYKDFKKFLAEAQAGKSKIKRTFVRDKFGNLSLEAGDPADIVELLKNIDVMLKKYIGKRIKEEADAKS